MDAGLLGEWFDELAPIGADPSGGVTRLAYTPEEDGMFEKVASFAARLGFVTAEDCAGNMHISFPGGEDAPCHTIGSHLDSVPRGGMYDGVAGVLAGLLVMEKVRRLGLSIPVKTVAFRCEESSLFGLATAGSGVVTGSIGIPDLERAKSASGQSLGEAMKNKGYNPGTCRLGGIIDFTELHIEQGRCYGNRGKNRGAVAAITTQVLRRLFSAQTTPAHTHGPAKGRPLAAAEVILRARKGGGSEMGFATVATTGVIRVTRRS